MSRHRWYKAADSLDSPAISRAHGNLSRSNATRSQRAGVKRSAGSRHRFGSAMDSYSIRFASGRISPNLDPQVCDCWLDTTGKLHRAQRPGRYKARDALSMPRGQRALRIGRPPPPRQTVHEAPPRLPGECCRPNRWRRGDRRALAAHALHSSTIRESSDALAWRRMTARGTLSSWSNGTAGDVNGLFLIISDQEMPKIGFMRLNWLPPSLW